MKRPYILNDYRDLSGPNLLVLCQVIRTGMNANFTDCPDLSVLNTKIDVYALSYTAAQNGGAAAKALRDQDRASLVGELYHVSDWVMYTCNGERPASSPAAFW